MTILDQLKRSLDDLSTEKVALVRIWLGGTPITITEGIVVEDGAGARLSLEAEGAELFVKVDAICAIETRTAPGRSSAGFLAR